MSEPTIMLIISCVTVLFYLFVAICQCFIFKKAGEKWWKALIPIWGEVTLFKLVWKRRYVIIYLLGGAMMQLITVTWSVMAHNTSLIEKVMNSSVLIALFILVSVYYVVVLQMSVRLAVHFGWAEEMGVAISFLPFVFYPILAFGKSKYNKDAKLVF